MIFISIDPGTSTLGVAVWDISFLDNIKINDVTTFTVLIDSKQYIDRRVNQVYRTLIKLYEINQPTFIVHESGFMDRFRPMAYGPIYATIHNIRQAFRDYNKSFDYKDIYMYSPKYVKARIGKGTADKDDMLTAVKGIKELNVFLNDTESEHEIDALAIGYSHILNMRAMPEIIFI